MNKLLGFYELKESGLPTVPWIEFKGEKLSKDCLWTVRTAVYRGADLNLPRCVGVEAEAAEEFAKKISGKYNGNAMIVYYPYFLADKSGTLNITTTRIIVEAVKDDLWNFVTEGKRDVTIVKENGEINYYGDKSFITNEELKELESNVGIIRKLFRDDLVEGKSVQLEWSYAYKSNLSKERVGDRFLVFYEARTID